MTPAEQHGVIESHESIRDPEDIEAVAECFRIVRNFQERGPKAVLAMLREHFSEKTGDELESLIKRVQGVIE